MSIYKYFLCTGSIFFFMFFSNYFVHSENAYVKDPFEGLNIKIVKKMKTSAEIIDFLSLRLNISKEELEDIFFNPDRLEESLGEKPKKAKKDWPPILEITKKKILITYICQRITWAAFLVAEKKAKDKSQKMSDKELDQLYPEMRDLLDSTSKLIRMCAGADFIAS